MEETRGCSISREWVELDNFCPLPHLLLSNLLIVPDKNFVGVGVLSQSAERPLVVQRNVIYNIIRWGEHWGSSEIGSLLPLNSGFAVL
jgi:hypothetical protein